MKRPDIKRIKKSYEMGFICGTIQDARRILDLCDYILDLESQLQQAQAENESLREQLRKYRGMLNDSQCKTDQCKNDLQIMTTCRDHWKTSYEDIKAQLQEAQAENKELKIKPAVFCDAAHCQFGKVIQIGDGWNEPYATDFDCSKADDLSKQGYDDFEMDGDYPICPMFRFDVSDWEHVIKQLEAENAGLRANSLIQEHIIESNRNPQDKEEIVRLIMENAGLRELVKEYYNKVMREYHSNMSAAGLKEAYFKLKAIVEGDHPGDSLLKELEALRAVKDAAEEVCKWIFPIDNENLAKVVKSDIDKLCDALAAVKGEAYE